MRRGLRVRIGALASAALLAFGGVVAGIATPAHAAQKVIYFTFDDGPNPVNTPQILWLLDKYDAQATFFMVGDQAEKAPDLVKQVRREGHVIGNHTYSHPWLTSLTAAGVRAQIRRGDVAFGATTCLRPPGGLVNDSVRAVINAEHKATWLWTVDTADWAKPAPRVIAQRIMDGAAPGAVVLMHDGGGDRWHSVQALAAVLPKLSAQGYEFRALPSCT